MASDYGIDADAVASYAQGLAFSASTVPTSAQVDAWIARAALRYDATVRAAGVDPDSLHADTDSEGYALGSDYVVLRVASLAISSRNGRPTDLADRYQTRSDSLLDEARRWAASLGDARTVSTGAPGLADYSARTAQDSGATDDAAFLNGARGQL